MKKGVIFILILLTLTACTPAPTPQPTATKTPTPTQALTAAQTLKPTSTPKPLKFDQSQLVFPYDLTETIQELPNGANRSFTYHYTHRLSNDPCGGHIGDVLTPLSMWFGHANIPGYDPENETYTGYSFRIIQPFSGIVDKMWVTDGNDLGITFFIGESNQMDYYLSIFHHDRYYDPGLTVGDFVSAGDVLGYEEKGNNFNFDDPYNPYIEGKIHLVLEHVPRGNVPPDFIDANPESSLDVSIMFLPETILQTTGVELPLLVKTCRNSLGECWLLLVEKYCFLLWQKFSL
jgi:hypothetical protein